jgi:hypothetical protein
VEFTQVAAEAVVGHQDPHLQVEQQEQVAAEQVE